MPMDTMTTPRGYRVWRALDQPSAFFGIKGRFMVLFIILAGVMVYALYCIKNDSYFGVGTDTRTYRAVMWIVIVCNAISGFSGLKDGAMVDGKLAFGPFASLLFCVAFVIIMISISIKQRNLAKEEAAEDDM